MPLICTGCRRVVCVCSGDEPRTSEHVEAEVRLAMHKHMLISPRGFDSIRKRQEIHREIDVLLDEHAMREAVAWQVAGRT
jgi:EAL domain-containing protein (putative c-di-GMP-specific phosphodiesterase class I)